MYDKCPTKMPANLKALQFFQLLNLQLIYWNELHKDVLMNSLAGYSHKQ